MGAGLVKPRMVRSPALASRPRHHVPSVLLPRVHDEIVHASLSEFHDGAVSVLEFNLVRPVFRQCKIRRPKPLGARYVSDALEVAALAQAHGPQLVGQRPFARTHDMRIGVCTTFPGRGFTGRLQLKSSPRPYYLASWTGSRWMH